MEFLNDFRDLQRFQRIPHFVAVERGGEWGYQNISFPTARFSVLWEKFRSSTQQDVSGLIHIEEIVEDLHFHLLIARKKLATDHEIISVFRQEARLIGLRGIGRIDSATSLFHKKSFLSRLEKLLRTIPENELPLGNRSAASCLSLILFDIDHFKRFNDLHGHLTGDRVIQAVAAVLRRISRGHDGFAARYGGEEFALLLPGRNERGALKIAEEIRGALQSLTLTDTAGHSIPGITVSLGVAGCHHRGGRKPGAMSQRLIEQADLALYVCKDLGRNRSFRFDRFRDDRGRLVETVGSNLALINLGPLHGVNPGTIFRVIHGRFDGERRLTEPETGRLLAPAPAIVKGRVEVIPPGTICLEGIDSSLSLVRFHPLLDGFQAEPGDRLQLEHLPGFSPRETYEFGISFTGEPFVTVETAMDHALERGMNPAFITLPDWKEMKERLGRDRAEEELRRIGRDLSGNGRTVLPFSTDRAVILFPPEDASRISLDEVLTHHGLQAIEPPIGNLPDREGLLMIRRLLDFQLPQSPRTIVSDPLLLDFARHFQRCGDATACAAILDRLTAPEDAAVEEANLRGWLALTCDRLDKAADIYQQAVTLSPETPENHVNLGIIRLKQRQPVAAAESFEQALTLSPGDAQARNNLADALIHSGEQLERAVQLAKEAFDRAQTDSVRLTSAETLITALAARGNRISLRRQLRRLDRQPLDTGRLLERAAIALTHLNLIEAAAICHELTGERGTPLSPGFTLEPI